MVHAAYMQEMRRHFSSRTQGEEHSQPILQVDIKYAATVHAFWPIVLNVWDKSLSALTKAKKKRRIRKSHTQSHGAVKQPGAFI
jgi:hypothetical protein